MAAVTAAGGVTYLTPTRSAAVHRSAGEPLIDLEAVQPPVQVIDPQLGVVFDIFLDDDRRSAARLACQFPPLDDHRKAAGQAPRHDLGEMLVDGLDDQPGALEGVTGGGQVGGHDRAWHGT